MPEADPLVDVIIPVHDASRPLDRAVTSLLASGIPVGEGLRITVICHNVAPAEIEAILSPAALAAVRLIPLADGIPSPAGPFTLGIERATARYVSIMGSDDTLEEGALRAWLDRALELDLVALIPPERHASGAIVHTPPTRPFRRGLLDGYRDRLAYRTAPLGLISREAVPRLQLEFPTRLRSGSDQLFGLKLWFSGERVAYGRGLPRYVVGADAVTRVTLIPRPAAVEFMAITELVAEPWFQQRGLRDRRAIVVKTVRVHLFSGAATRTDRDTWTPEDRATTAALVQTFREAAPGFERSLSLADRALLDALARGDESVERLAARLAARRRFGHPTTILPRDLRGLFATDGPLRFLVASRLV